MTPRRRDRFFLSLHQLEERLASESSQIKKTRPVADNAFADTESEGLATNASTISKSHRSLEVANLQPPSAQFGSSSAKLADADPTSINEVHVQAGIAHVRLRPPADAHPTAAAAKTTHLESSVARMGSTGAHLVNSLLRLANTSHGGPYIEPADVELAAGDYPTQICASAKAEVAGLVSKNATIRDVDGKSIEEFPERVNVGRTHAHVGPVRMPMGESTAHIQPALGLHRSTSVGFKGTIFGSELSIDKDGSADAEAMCLRNMTGTTIRRRPMNDEGFVNVGDDLLMCSMDSRETRGICENEAAGSRDIIDVTHGSRCLNDPLPIAIDGNLVHETVKIVARPVVAGDISHESRGEKGGTEYDTVNKNDAVVSSGDGIDCVNVDDSAHNRESLESITLCEDEEQMYDAIFSIDGEDSGSLLVLSAHWNPWDMGRHTDGFDSNPPADFVSTPIFNKTLDMIDRKTPELSSKCVCGDLQLWEGNGSQDLTHLCGLLGLDEDGLCMQDKEPSGALQVNELLLSSDQSSPDFGALNHELSGSIFYSKVAKVGDNRFQYAEALDFWLRRISQAQTEPYCRALLLIAKASLLEDKGLSICSLCKFPSIIQEWLAVQHAVDRI